MHPASITARPLTILVISAIPLRFSRQDSSSLGNYGKHRRMRTGVRLAQPELAIGSQKGSGYSTAGGPRGVRGPRVAVTEAKSGSSCSAANAGSCMTDGSLNPFAAASRRVASAPAESPAQAYDLASSETPGKGVCSPPEVSISRARARSSSASAVSRWVARAQARAQRASASRKRSPWTAGSDRTRSASACDFDALTVQAFDLGENHLSGQQAPPRVETARLDAVETLEQPARVIALVQLDQKSGLVVSGPDAGWVGRRQGFFEDLDGPVDLLQRLRRVAELVAAARQLQPIDAHVRMIRPETAVSTSRARRASSTLCV